MLRLHRSVQRHDADLFPAFTRWQTRPLRQFCACPGSLLSPDATGDVDAMKALGDSYKIDQYVKDDLVEARGFTSENSRRAREEWIL